MKKRCKTPWTMRATSVSADWFRNRKGENHAEILIISGHECNEWDENVRRCRGGERRRRCWCWGVCVFGTAAACGCRIIVCGAAEATCFDQEFMRHATPVLDNNRTKTKKEAFLRCNINQ